MRRTADVPDGYYATVGQRHPMVYRAERGVLKAASGWTLYGPLYAEMRPATPFEIKRWKARRPKKGTRVRKRIDAEQHAEILAEWKRAR